MMLRSTKKNESSGKKTLVIDSPASKKRTFKQITDPETNETTKKSQKIKKISEYFMKA